MRSADRCQECAGTGRSYFISRKLPCPHCLGAGGTLQLTPIEQYIQERKPAVSLPGRLDVPAYILETLTEAGLD